MRREGTHDDLIETAKSNWLTDIEIFSDFLRMKRKSLGLSQSDVETQSGIKQPTLSRIESGKIQINFPTAQALANLYNLSRAEIDKWFPKIYGLKVTNLEGGERGVDDAMTLSVIRRDTYFAEELLKFISRTRLEGDPQTSIKMINRLSGWCKEREGKLSSTVLLQPVNKILVLALYEKMLAYEEILKPAALLTYTLPIANAMRDIEKRYGDREILAYANFTLGDSYYILHKYASSSRLLAEAQDGLSSSEHLLLLLRVLALDLAYLAEEKNFQRVVERIDDLLQSGQFSNMEPLPHVLEGVARGQALLRHDIAFQTIETAWDIHRDLASVSGTAPLAEVQLVRSNLEIIKRLSPNDSRTVEQLGNRGLEVARQYGYWRHIQQIQDLVEELLN